MYVKLVEENVELFKINGLNFMTITKSHNAVNLYFTDNRMVIYIEDGRELSIPLEWFPTLRNATTAQLKQWRLIGNGEGIHWDEIDEDILIENLLN